MEKTLFFRNVSLVTVNYSDSFYNLYYINMRRTFELKYVHFDYSTFLEVGMLILVGLVIRGRYALLFWTADTESADNLAFWTNFTLVNKRIFADIKSWESPCIKRFVCLYYYIFN